MSLAEYSFLPWVRRGIANQIKSGAGASSRAKIPVTLTLKGGENTTLNLPQKEIQLVGPGDIIGINPLMVVRTEPKNWITNFEPNYLPFIEFYDEDFPWRYTPENPTIDHRLTPWVTLMVLKENEFERVNIPNRPLNSVKLTSKAKNSEIFPPNNELWAWAHVHLNESLSNNNHVPDLDSLENILKNNPDKGISRIFSPRKLSPETPYYAFLIPTYDIGRKAGIGIEVKDNDSAQILAWQNETEFPIYHEWFFRTSVGGDFEELVRLLKPRDIPKEVGIRDLDISEPGFGINDVKVLGNGLVGMEGALLSPTSQHRPIDFDAASDFPEKIEPLINLADDIQKLGQDEDPVVTPPLYGRWHALVNRLSIKPTDKNWVNELNSDARQRATAGLGALIIQKNQEEYMRQAWQSIGDVITVNNRISMAQMAMIASESMFKKSIQPMDALNVIPMISPVFKKVMGSPTTIHYLHKTSILPQAVTEGAFRKLLRPRGLMAKRFFGKNAFKNQIGEVIKQINEGKITAAPPFPKPSAPTIEDFINQITPKISGWLRYLLNNNWLIFFIVLLVLLILVLTFFSIPMLVFTLSMVALSSYFVKKSIEIKRTLAGIESLKPQNQTPESVDNIPLRPFFEITQLDDNPSNSIISAGNKDSETANNFRMALKDYFSVTAFQPEIPKPKPMFDFQNAHQKVMNAIQPMNSFQKRITPTIKMGELNYYDYLKKYYIGIKNPEQQIIPVKNYPDIKQAMYEPLKKANTDYFVPNLSLIPPNTISLMITNQPFIESYMVGLNHEFARELLWREYPTDQRGSVFRQFWNPVNFVNQDGLTEKEMANKLKDITPIHTWRTSSNLGEHNNRTSENDQPKIMLVIKGDLLKRYPNTVIYAQKAKWGDITTQNPNLRLVTWDESGEIAENNPNEKDHVKYPIITADVEPDISFIGFDLTIQQAQGNKDLNEDQHSKDTISPDDLGWFFIIKERPGEPRFGMDVNQDPENPSPKKWDNMSWDLLGTEENVKIINLAAITPNPPHDPNVNDGLDVKWNSNSADMAYILYQKPVLVAIHAKEMLKNLK
jgi:hypothetical protein